MKLSRNIMVGLIVTTMTLASTNVAQAQPLNVFGSSSSSLTSGSSSHTDSKSMQLKRSVEEANLRAGHTKNAEAEREAEKLLARALNGELAYYEDMHYQETYYPVSKKTVVRVRKVEVDTVIDQLENFTPETIITAPFGVAAGADEDYYYIAEVFIIR